MPTTSESGAVVGTVRGIWRYPVKSMAAEPLSETEVGWAGLAGDRRWAFVRPDSGANGFPWHTIREQPEMCRYTARLTEPARPDRSGVEVRTPEGDVLDVTDDALADRLGSGVRLMRLDRGAFDEAPVSMLSTTSFAEVCRLAEVAPDERRFRPNLVLEPAPGEPFAEDALVGSVVQVGEVQVRFDQRDSRCRMVDVDPETGERSGRVLKTVGTHRDACVGIYGTVVRRGVVRVGDEVSVLG